MKYLIMCEGTDELAVINILLDNDMLKISRDDLLGLQAYHARQIDKSVVVQTELRLYPYKDIEILRIGDKQGDELKIPREFKDKLSKERIKKYCTKPELEILFIISDSLLDKYEKEKSYVKASEFAKKEIKFKREKYSKSVKFYEDYFEGRPELLAELLRKYKQINGSHKKDELYLCDLLK
ncbi:MAG: GNAT family acetyltransferase [Ruminococcus sp.]|nr:GNAT family acetyltransferase [Ruminococcus sp.]